MRSSLPASALLGLLLATGGACDPPRPAARRSLRSSPDAHPLPPVRRMARRPPLHRPSSPRPRPRLPQGLQILAVPKHRPAVFVAPRRRDAPPWPLILILHGNFDRPEWECGAWAPAATPRGWLLCPRGVRRPGVPRALDRWTYPGSAAAIRETHAALDRLKARYPSLLREDGALFIGFSLGAILSARVMLGSRVRFGYAVLVEGGAGIDPGPMRRLAKRGLRRVAYLCGEYSGCRGRVKKARRRWRRAKVPSRLWIMPQVGHHYSDGFDTLGAEVLRWLFAKE